MDYKDIEIVEVQRTEAQSLHRVAVKTQEINHLHVRHDSTVIMQEGQGSLYLAGHPQAMKPGTAIMIPRNVPHYFVNTAGSSPSRFLVIFSPPYDGKDRVPLE